MVQGYSTSTLFYGLWFRASELLFAARAHDQIAGAITTINTIIDLRDQDILKIRAPAGEKAARIDSIPTEVWLVVQRKLREAVVELETDAINELRCKRCENAGWKKGREAAEGAGAASFRPIYEWSTYRDPKHCDKCRSSFRGSSIAQLNWILPAPVEKLLCNYGLAQVSNPVWLGTWRTVEEEEDWHFDQPIPDPKPSSAEFDSCIAIGLPLGIRGAPGLHYPLLSLIAGQGYNAHGIFSFSPEVFNLPPNANRRFANLIADYALSPLVKDRAHVVKSEPHVPRHRETKDCKAVQALPSPFVADQPRWMLWSNCGED